MIIIGPSGSGKTQLLLNLIMRWLKWDKLYSVTPSVNDQRCYKVLKDFNENAKLLNEEGVILIGVVEDNLDYFLTKMHFDFCIIGIISGFIWTNKCTDAIATVTLTASSSPYFDIGGSISLTCAINEDVNITSANLYKDRVVPYVLINIKGPSSCVFYKYISADPHVYSVTCDQRTTVHIVMNGTNATDHNATWSCDMTAESGICNNPSCNSISGVTTAQRVPVSSVQLTDGTGQLLVTPVPVLDGSNKEFQCDTSPNGSRPRAFFNWYKRSENQSPILIQDQSVSTPSPRPEVDLSISISYSTLTLMGNRSYRNMYIYCEAQDETNRGNLSKSREAQLNIVYPPVVQLLPNASVFNVTEGSPKFVFICNVTDANPIPQPDGYSWLLRGIVIQGQTRSSYELLNVQKSQDGVYHCMARNGYGNGNSSTLELNVQYGPTISLIDYTEVEEGENVSIACSVIANPQPDIVWTRNGTVILQSSDTLRIPYISRLNEGNYTCTASNVLYPTGQSFMHLMATDTLRISVLYGPGNSSSLTSNISVYEVEEGQKAVGMICRATCNPACSYRWMKGNVQINSNNTLSLGIVQKNMTGNYICEAFNTIRGQRRGSNKSVEVIVTYAPVVKLQAAVRDVNPYRVKQGRENVVLMCEVVDAYPQPTLFVWTHNGNEIQNESRSNLTIHVATRQTNGTWGCKGLNGHGRPIESQLQVDVQYGPDIESVGNKTVREGQLFSVTCNIYSNPMPVSVSWKKDNNSTFSHNTSVLKVDSISRYNSGTYRCTAVNIIHPSGQSEESLNGTECFYLNVQYGAEIINLSVAEGNTVNENTTATIRCLVDSNPESHITWTRQGIMGILQTNLSVHASQLIIEHAECLDTDNYTCNARNGFGHPVERNVSLYVTCHPRTDFRSPLVTKVYSKLYGNASLNYTVISFPEPTFNWSFIGNGSENRWLPDSATKYDNGMQSVLVFTNLSINDFGFYKVIAKNKFPTSAIEVFQLIPAGPPQIVHIFNLSRFIANQLEFHFKPGFNGGRVQSFVIEYKSMVNFDSSWRNSSVTDLKESETTNGSYFVNITQPPPGNYEYRMYSWNDIGRSPYSVVITVFIPEVPSTSESHGVPVAGIAGGISAGIVIILGVVISMLLWRRYQRKQKNEHNPETRNLDNDETGDDEESTRRNQIEDMSVKQDVPRGKEYEGLHFTKAEATQYLQLNDITLEENRDPKTRYPEGDSYEKLHPYANSDTQMYSSLKIPKTSKDSEAKYENTRIKQPD